MMDTFTPNERGAAILRRRLFAVTGGLPVRFARRASPATRAVCTSLALIHARAGTVDWPFNRLAIYAGVAESSVRLAVRAVQRARIARVVRRARWDDPEILIVSPAWDTADFQYQSVAAYLRLHREPFLPAGLGWLTVDEPREGDVALAAQWWRVPSRSTRLSVPREFT